LGLFLSVLYVVLVCEKMINDDSQKLKNDKKRMEKKKTKKNV